MADQASPQHLFADVLARVHAVCGALATEGRWSAGIDLSRVVVEPPRDPAHGDVATNAAMVLTRQAKTKPRDLAEQIAARLRADDLIASVDIAGPGFINLTLKASAWSEALRTVLREGSSYGRSAMDAGEKVNVEYVSANPTGPMHVGHGRGAVFGDALANLLIFAGYDVVREYYVNDAGAQVDVLARSAHLRYREALGENIGEIPEGRYPGEYLKPVGQSLATAYGDDVDRPLKKSDGGYTYFASDIAYHKNKFDRGFHNLVDVWGADHGGYIKRVEAAIKAVTSGKATLDVKVVQLVKLLRSGEPVKMSKRSGDFVTLREVVDEVGKDAVRFMMLYRKNDAVLDFDLAKVIEQSRENPVFYVQYGHARGHSVFRNAREDVVPDL